jgi:hypothetical protein
MVNIKAHGVGFTATDLKKGGRCTKDRDSQ